MKAIGVGRRSFLRASPKKLSRVRALSLMPATELLRYMSALYPKDQTLARGNSVGRRVFGQRLPDFAVHVSNGSPSTPWTRTMLDGCRCVNRYSMCPCGDRWRRKDALEIRRLSRAVELFKNRSPLRSIHSG